MENNLIIIRYGELALKSPYVRNYFENKLIDNIRNKHKSKKIKYSIEKQRGRIYLKTDNIKKSIEILQKTFGITSVSPAVETNSEIKKIVELTLKKTKKTIKPNTTFAVKTKRTGKHSYSSQDISIILGEKIIKETKGKVDLENPEITIFVEIRDNRAFIFTEKKTGTGGLPVGTQGKVITFIDGNESFLSAYYMLKRGCEVVYLLRDKEKKQKLDHFINTWQNKAEIITIDDIRDYFVFINKRSKKEHYAAFISDIKKDDIPEKMGYIHKLKNNITIPVLYPLIGLNKKTINEKIKKIGLNI